MANFKAALKALGTGKLKHESLSKQLDSVLNASPKFASKMLSDLDESQFSHQGVTANNDSDDPEDDD